MKFHQIAGTRAGQPMQIAAGLVGAHEAVDQRHRLEGLGHGLLGAGGVLVAQAQHHQGAQQGAGALVQQVSGPRAP